MLIQPLTCFPRHAGHWVDRGLTSPTVHVLGRNMLARCIAATCARAMVARLLARTVRGNHGENPGSLIHGSSAHFGAVPAAAIFRQRMGLILLLPIAPANISQ